MEIRVRPETGKLILQPVGPINNANADSFRSALLAAVDGHKVQIEIDLDEVPYLTSAALRVMAIAVERLRQRNQKLQISNASPSVYQILDLANFTSLLEILN